MGVWGEERGASCAQRTCIARPRHARGGVRGGGAAVQGGGGAADTWQRRRCCDCARGAAACCPPPSPPFLTSVFYSATVTVTFPNHPGLTGSDLSPPHSLALRRPRSRALRTVGRWEEDYSRPKFQLITVISFLYLKQRYAWSPWPGQTVTTRMESAVSKFLCRASPSESGLSR